MSSKELQEWRDRVLAADKVKTPPPLRITYQEPVCQDDTPIPNGDVDSFYYLTQNSS
jgi:hypothetical protein